MRQSTNFVKKRLFLRTPKRGLPIGIRIPCISAQGKNNILLKCKEQTVLIIAVGAAFGPEIGRIMNIIVYLHENEKESIVHTMLKFDF
jgi:hypothetical protein